MYSFGIICHEIIQCSGPFNTYDDGNDIGATEVQYSTVQYSTVQYSTVQYSAVQHSTVHQMGR